MGNSKQEAKDYGTCKASTKDNKSCSNNARANGYCGIPLHQAQAAAQHGDTSSKGSKGSSSSSTSSTGNARKTASSAQNDSSEGSTSSAQSRPTSSSTASSSVKAGHGFRVGAPGEKLNQTRVLPDGNVELSGCNYSSADKRDWLHVWSKCTGRTGGVQTCVAYGCSANAVLGGHLWMKGQRGVRTCFIAPICSRHNNRNHDYPTGWFKAKQGIALMRING